MDSDVEWRAVTTTKVAHIEDALADMKGDIRAIRYMVFSTLLTAIAALATSLGGRV